METLAKRIINRIVLWSNHEYAEEDIEVFYYGAECMLNSLSVDFVLLLWGILTHTLLPTLCWLFVFSIYRHHAGGIHASTNERCILISSLLGISNYITILYPAFFQSNDMIILAISFIICLIFAPIESTKKELTKKEQWKEKSIALGIILIAVIFKSFLPEELFISVVYSLLVANVLVIFSVIKQN